MGTLPVSQSPGSYRAGVSVLPVETQQDRAFSFPMLVARRFRVLFHLEPDTVVPYHGRRWKVDRTETGIVTADSRKDMRHVCESLLCLRHDISDGIWHLRNGVVSTDLDREVSPGTPATTFG